MRLIATAHSYGVEDLKCRLGVGKLIGIGGFEGFFYWEQTRKKMD